jgi:hypothetical protein
MRNDLIHFLKNFKKQNFQSKPQEIELFFNELKTQTNRSYDIKIIFPDKYLTSDCSIFKHHILETEQSITNSLKKIGKKWHSDDYMLLWVRLYFYSEIMLLRGKQYLKITILSTIFYVKCFLYSFVLLNTH